MDGVIGGEGKEVDGKRDMGSERQRNMGEGDGGRVRDEGREKRGHRREK